MSHKLRLAVALICLAGIAPLFAAAEPPAKPKLIVAISVDQFSAGIFDQYRGRFTGGLKRMIDQGVVFPNGYQSHAATETCPGHSTILTGRHPSGTGIIGNHWLDAETGAKVYCVEDDTVTVPGRPNDPRGPAHLRVSTLGEWLKAQNPASRTVAVAGKDRAAITMAGHDPTAVFWWDDERGFTTYVPKGADETERLAPVKAFNDALVKPKNDDAAKVAFKASTALDQATLNLAGALIKRYKLGQGAATDLLAISLSATDYVGHRYGNQGPEMRDQLKRLDLALDGFLKRLDALKTSYLVALTADHGAFDKAERVAQRGFPAERYTADLVGDTNKVLREQLSLSFDPLKGDAQGLYLVRKNTDAALRERLLPVTLEIVRARPDVVAAFDKQTALQTRPPKNKPADELSLIERFAESVDAERSPDILIALKPYISVGKPKPPENYVAGHGSPWNYDRRVPILFWWPGAQGYEQYLPVETVDIAPTLAALAGVTPPEVDGRCIDLNRDAASTCPAH